MKKPKQPAGIVNRRARYDYELGDSFVVGMALTGAETKSLRLGHGDLSGAYTQIKNGELWLVGSQVFGSGGIPVADETRTRKLLAKKSEIERLAAGRQSGYSIVPLEVLAAGRYVKLRLALGRGKKRYDKRETIKKRQQEREARRVV